MSASNTGMRKRGIEVRTGVLVQSVDARSATLSDGTTVSTRTIVWSAGVKPEDPAKDEDVPHSRSQRIQVDDRRKARITNEVDLWTRKRDPV